MADKETKQRGRDIRKHRGNTGEHVVGREGVGDGVLHNVDSVSRDRQVSDEPTVLQDNVHGEDAGKETLGGSFLLPTSGEGIGHKDQHSDESSVIPLQDGGLESRGNDDDNNASPIPPGINTSGGRDTEIKVPIPSNRIELDTVRFKFTNPTTNRAVIVAGNSYTREFLKQDEPFLEKLTDYERFLASSRLFKIVATYKVSYERD